MSETSTDQRAGVFATLRDTPTTARFLLFGVFVNRLGAFMQAFLVLYLVQRGFTETQAGLALGAYGAGAVLGVLFGGGLSDRLGPRRTIVASMAGAAVLTVAVLWMSNLYALLVVVTAVGALSQAYRPASAALLSDLIPAARQVMVFAVYRLGLNLGTVVGPLLAALLITYSWNLLFWVEGLAALGYALIAIFLLPRDHQAKDGASAADGPATGYGVVFRDARYLLFLFAMLVNALVYVQYLGVLPLALKDAGLAEPVYYSILLTLNAGLVIACELLVTKWVQYWPARLAVVIGFGLLGAGLAMYALPGGLAIFVVGTVVWSMGEVVGGPTMFAYPAKAAPAAAKGRYLGAAHAMFGIGGAVGPPLGVAIWAQAGNVVWWVCAGGALLAILAATAGIREVPEGGAEAADGAGAKPADGAGAADPAVAAEAPALADSVTADVGGATDPAAGGEAAGPGQGGAVR